MTIVSQKKCQVKTISSLIKKRVSTWPLDAEQWENLPVLKSLYTIYIVIVYLLKLKSEVSGAAHSGLLKEWIKMTRVYSEIHLFFFFFLWSWPMVYTVLNKICSWPIFLKTNTICYWGYLAGETGQTTDGTAIGILYTKYDISSNVFLWYSQIYDK